MWIMVVRAVIFDWGGTLTPWHTVDHVALWREVCALHFAGEHAERHAAAIHAAERDLWLTAERDGRSATIAHVFERAGGGCRPRRSWPATSGPGSRTR